MLPVTTTVRGVMLETSLSEFTVQESVDGQIFEDVGTYSGTGNPLRPFWVRKQFTARYIRICPRRWHQMICVKFDALVDIEALPQK